MWKYMFSKHDILCTVKGKGKVHPRGPNGEYSYSYTLSLTYALGRVGCQRHAPAALPPGNRPVTQGRIKLFGAPRQWKHFRPLFQAAFLSGGGGYYHPD